MMTLPFFKGSELTVLTHSSPEPHSKGWTHLILSPHCHSTPRMNEDSPCLATHQFQ